MGNKKGSIRRRVSYQETDQMGVVHHANYVTWFEVARTEWMRTIGIAYSEMERQGLMLPVRSLEIKYLKPAVYDQEVLIFTEIDSYTAVRLDFSYEVRTLPPKVAGSLEMVDLEDARLGELLVSGSSGHMWVDMDWKPVRIDRTFPDVFHLLTEYGPESP